MNEINFRVNVPLSTTIFEIIIAMKFFNEQNITSLYGNKNLTSNYLYDLLFAR